MIAARQDNKPQKLFRVDRTSGIFSPHYHWMIPSPIWLAACQFFFVVAECPGTAAQAYLPRRAYTRRIMTSVALMRAAAAWPGLSCISRAERAVMIDVICWFPIESVTSAMRPLIRTSSMRPTS